MPRARLVRSVDVVRTPRVLQLEGMFDIPLAKTSSRAWEIHLPIEDRPWNIGLVVGPSGSGKTTILREVFPNDLIGGLSWPADRAVVDGFPVEMSIKEVTALLSSVGFSSPPSWLVPFECLSNGEQFRATLARSLAQPRELVVFDEFTSVVDRTVAKIGSAALAKTVRSRSMRFIAATCHEDVEEWLQPDWVYRTDAGQFHWRRLRQRPDIRVVVHRCGKGAWRAFRRHHYLSGDLHAAAKCYLGQVDGRPAAFGAVIAFPHPVRPGWREHRLVCQPDFQGVGIGNALSEFIASRFVASGKPYFSTTSAPAMIHHRARSRKWRMMRSPSRSHRQTLARLETTSSFHRLTASFEYVGPASTNEQCPSQSVPRREEDKGEKARRPHARQADR